MPSGFQWGSINRVMPGKAWSHQLISTSHSRAFTAARFAVSRSDAQLPPQRAPGGILDGDSDHQREGIRSELGANPAHASCRIETTGDRILPASNRRRSETRDRAGGQAAGNLVGTAETLRRLIGLPVDSRARVEPVQARSLHWRSVWRWCAGSAAPRTHKPALRDSRGLCGPRDPMAYTGDAITPCEQVSYVPWNSGMEPSRETRLGPMSKLQRCSPMALKFMFLFPKG